jgi:hypothetical protein
MGTSADARRPHRAAAVLALLVAVTVGLLATPAVAAAPAPGGSGTSAAPLVLTDAAGKRVASTDLNAQASIVVTIRNAQTGLCLDSNYAGNVYTLGCNGGNYQRWRIESGGTILTIHNVQTGRCLDQNGQGSIYTLGCNGGSYQLWFGSGGTTANTNIVHNFYGGVLDSNYAGHVYCLPRNGGNYQNWYFTVA